MDRKFFILPFSAETEDSLHFLMQDIAAYLEMNMQLYLGDLEYTLLASRSPHPCCAFLVASDMGSVKEIIAGKGSQLREWYEPGQRKAPVLLFPGGGAQHVNMARKLYQSEAYFTAMVDEGLGYARDFNGVDYRTILYPLEETGHDEITATEIALPLLFIIEYSLARYLIHLGMVPGAMIGHSLGEYAAAAVAGVFSYRDAVKIVCCRGALMNKVEPGLMLSVAASPDNVSAFLGTGVSIGAINSPGHCMLSGRKAAVETLKLRLETSGIQVKLIHIAVASHSPMMDSILGEFRDMLLSVDIRPPLIPFVSNLYGDWAQDHKIDADYWTKHLRNTVRFSEGISKIITAFPDSVFIEVGPGHTLSNLCRLQIGDLSRTPIINILRHPLSPDDDTWFFLQAIGELWAYGYPLNPDAYFAGQNRQKIALPWGYTPKQGSIIPDTVFDLPIPPEIRIEKARDKMGLMRSISRNK